MSSNPFLTNRFSNLENESINKKNKKIQHYVSSKNIFNKPDDKLNNSDLFNITDELFPSLTPITIFTENQPNFKDVLIQENISQPEDKITNGWIEIYKIDNSIIYNEDKYKEMNQEKYKNSDNVTIMNKFVSIMQKKYESYKNNYDNINGDGAYNDIYLTIAYDSDNDSDNDEYDSNTEDDIEYEYDYDDYVNKTY
jgi:hypothetical protein